MNKRQLQKKRTRSLILESAKQCFMENGFLNTPVSKISSHAKIAHGTLFAHFPTKEALILEVITIEMKKIGEEIQKFAQTSESIEEILVHYLDFLIEEEQFFSVLAKERLFYSNELKRKLIFHESIIRGYFHQILEEENAQNISHCEDITSSLNWLFGVINYYFGLKESFVASGSVISKFKDSILSTFKKIIL